MRGMREHIEKLNTLNTVVRQMTNILRHRLRVTARINDKTRRHLCKVIAQRLANAAAGRIHQYRRAFRLVRWRIGWNPAHGNEGGSIPARQRIASRRQSPPARSQYRLIASAASRSAGRIRPLRKRSHIWRTGSCPTQSRAVAYNRLATVGLV